MASGSINWFESGLGKAERARWKIIPPSFYNRNTLEVAHDLLGKILTVSSKEGITAARIVETEAYRGDDPASHSSRGVTPRCSVMFGVPGVAYVYFIYGMYEMLNFVTEPKGFPGAVLIRAVEPLMGEELMARRRGLLVSQIETLKETKPQARYELTRGPGKLTQAMGIQMSHNGQSLSGPDLFVTEDEFSVREIRTSSRIGISAAKEKPWRFFISENPFVSRIPIQRMTSGLAPELAQGVNRGVTRGSSRGITRGANRGVK